MSVTSPIGEPPAHESVDLAALGRDYKPPLADTSPEVADVIARMPWWASRGLVYIIIGFVIVAILWAALSKIDVVAESRGALVPEGYVKPVQAAGTGVVQNVFVREGEVVERAGSRSRHTRQIVVAVASYVTQPELCAGALHEGLGGCS